MKRFIDHDQPCPCHRQPLSCRSFCLTTVNRHHQKEQVRLASPCKYLPRKSAEKEHILVQIWPLLLSKKLCLLSIQIMPCTWSCTVCIVCLYCAGWTLWTELCISYHLAFSSVCPSCRAECFDVDGLLWAPFQPAVVVGPIICDHRFS